MWTFILFVACLDMHFAWQWQSSLPIWEINPVARFAYECGGYSLLAVYRLALLGFAYTMSRTKTRLAKYVTPTWACGHAYLLLILIKAWSIH